MKRAILIGGVVVYACIAVYAIVAMKKDVQEMAAEADHILVGTVDSVEMVDREGRPRDRGETGLTHDEVIRLRVTPLRVLKGGDAVPETLVLPLWRGWKHSLGKTTRTMEDNDFVFFLRGPGFDPLYLGEFYVPDDEREAVEGMLRQ